MKKIICIAFLVISAAVSAQEEGQTRGLLGDTASTNIMFVSSSVTNRAWRKDVLMATGKDLSVLKDKTGQFVEQTAVIDVTNTAAQISRIAQAWKTGFVRATNEFMTTIGSIPTNGVTIGLLFPLDTTGRQNLDMYVAAHEFDGENDRFWIYMSQQLDAKPNISVPYVTESGFTTNRVTGRWTDWKNDNISTNGYSGCKRFVVKRPIQLRPFLGDLNPHVKFGRPDTGFNWGSTVLFVNNHQTYTGEITNEVDQLVMKVFNGAILGINPIEQEEVPEPEQGGQE